MMMTGGDTEEHFIAGSASHPVAQMMAQIAH